MPIARLTPTYTFTEDRLAQLKQVVPEAFADGRINWETLRETLGDYLEDEDQPTERFGLFWPGKRKARRAAAQPPQGALRLAPGEGVNEESTRHVFIEGENLEVLKLLRKAYAGRVKMIYIDPPYNTGNDFVYPDDYSEPMDAYLRRTGQAGEAGEALTTNPRTSGRFHSNWLNMMLPRLALARQLLASDGAIFVSIDDNECHSLRILMDEVFGEESFVACVIWEKRITPDSRTDFATMHDYIMVYTKDNTAFSESRHLLPLTDEARGRYRNPDGDPRGDWLSVPATAQAGHGTPSQFYSLVTPDGRRLDPPPGRCWLYTEDRMRREIADDRIWFGNQGDGVPRIKRFLSEARGGLTPTTSWGASDVGANENAKQHLQRLFDDSVVFDGPKPVPLVRRMLDIVFGDGETGIALDFYAGSATTAEAVLRRNSEVGGDISFLLVQLPEPVNASSSTGRTAAQAGLATIAEIGKERIRRVIAGMKQDREGKLDLQDRDEPEDLGFRVYKLGRSQLKPWQPYEGESIEAVQTLFSQFESPLAEGWDPEALRVEVLLQEGFPLDSRVERLSAFADNAVDCVATEWCEHRLFICLDQAIADSTVRALPGAMGEQDILVCLDSALTDDGKLRLADRCNVHVI